MERPCLGPVGTAYPKQPPKPAKLGGRGKAADLTQGGLFGEMFPLSLNSTIIAVYGITTLQGSSSSHADGWFYTDFYLFHHLLKNTANE